MGFGIKELVIILAIIALLFGTKKIRGIGHDLGSAIKGFKKSMNDESADYKNTDAATDTAANDTADKDGDAK